MSAEGRLGRSEVGSLRELLAPHVRWTPLVRSAWFSDRLGCNLFFKLENVQVTGAFKCRGALARVLSMPVAQRQRGLVTASAGNHGLGVAFAARQVGVPACVYLPVSTPSYKVEAIRRYGAQVVLAGEAWDDANEVAQAAAEAQGLTYVHPFSDEAVIRGQSTIAYEVLEDLPDTDVMVCSIGGGGLIAGLSRYVPVRVYGVEPEGADSMSRSLQAGRVVTLDRVSTVAESLATRRVTPLTLGYAQRFVEDVVVVGDAAAEAQLLAVLQHEKQLVEPAASCTLAALEQGLIPDIQGKNVVVLLCGGNLAVSRLAPMLAAA